MTTVKQGQPRQEIGGPVPDFSLPLLSGATRNLASFLEGKKGAVVVFWSGVCTHCVRYDDYLNRFDSDHPELSLVAIASRQGEGAEQLRSTAAGRGLRFPILHDADSKVAEQWYTQQTPRSFLIDAARVLLYRGAIDNFKFPQDPDYLAYLEPAIDAFLSGRPVARKETPSFGCAIRSVYYILPKPL